MNTTRQNHTALSNNPTKGKENYRTIDLVYIAMGTVLITLCAWISIPTTVPFTMQIFAVFFVLLLLGDKRYTAAVAVYLLLGAFGVPVFSRFNSGIGVLMGTTGGYLIGYLFLGPIYRLITGLLGKKMWTQILAMVTGLAVTYAFGTAWFMLVYARTSGPIGLGASLAMCVIPFIIPDLIKLGLALTLARRLTPVLQLQ